MIIRPAQIEDAPEIANVQIKAHQETFQGLLPLEHLNNLPYNFKKRMVVWSNYIANPEIIIFVAENTDKEIIGYSSFEKSGDDQFEGHGQLTSIYLLKKYHGQGIGYNLLDHGMKSLLNKDFQKAYCWALAGNQKNSFYEKSGARFLGQTKVGETGGQKTVLQAYVWPDLTNFR